MHMTMGVLCILHPTMKPYLSIGPLLLALFPVWAGAADDRVHPLPADTPSVILPITADTSEPRTVIRLRDALRQPYDDLEEDSKPYRMSVQERQRMREQLRDRSLYDTSKK